MRGSMKGNTRVTLPAAIRIEVGESPKIAVKRSHLNHRLVLKKKDPDRSSCFHPVDLTASRNPCRAFRYHA